MARERSAPGARISRTRREGPGTRTGSRPAWRAQQNNRVRIAQVAARLIANHGIADWSLAKRKAARELMLPESTAMPSNDDLVVALTEHHALFGGDEHAASLRAQREQGLAWMRRLAQWDPLLVGGVAAGWATAHSEVRIELVADDPKAVEIALASQGVPYTALPPKGDDEKLAGSIQLRIESTNAPIRLSILAPQQRRNRPRRDDELRLSESEVSALLGA